VETSKTLSIPSHQQSSVSEGSLKDENSTTIPAPGQSSDAKMSADASSVKGERLDPETQLVKIEVTMADIESFDSDAKVEALGVNPSSLQVRRLEGIET
jgi:hypothetical protein